MNDMTTEQLGRARADAIAKRDRPRLDAINAELGRRSKEPKPAPANLGGAALRKQVNKANLASGREAPKTSGIFRTGEQVQTPFGQGEVTVQDNFNITVKLANGEMIGIRKGSKEHRAMRHRKDPEVSSAGIPLPPEAVAHNYLERYGAAGVRAKLQKLTAKKVKTARDKQDILALRRALNSSSGKA